MMVLFMAAYMMQWLFNVVFVVWSKVGVPQTWIFVVKVIFCNLGGLFNGLAYTVMRRRYLKADSNPTSSIRKISKSVTESNDASKSKIDETTT